METETAVSGLGKFKAEYFEAAEDDFCNLLSQKMGTSNSKLRYVICDRVVTEVFPDVATERMYKIHLSKEAFGEDNRIFLQMLREYLIKPPGWYWIDQFNAMDNGREAFWAWLDHYNGQAELSKRTHLDLYTLKTLHYKKE